MILGSLFGEFGHGSRVAPPFRYANLHQIKIGRGVVINRDCWIGVVCPDGDHSIKLNIGDRTAIGMGSTISAAERIDIGSEVLLARNVYISDHGHAFEDISRPIMDQGINTPSPVHIGRGTWLGQNVVVLPGSTIGEHCIIGANSVVKNAIPPFSIAVGSPARVVKQYNKSSRSWERSSLPRK